MRRKSVHIFTLISLPSRGKKKEKRKKEKTREQISKQNFTNSSGSVPQLHLDSQS